MVGVKEVYEFPEERTIVHLDLSDYKNFSDAKSDSKTHIRSPSTDFRLSASLLCVATIAIVIILSSVVIKFSFILGSFISFLTTLLLREWFRVFGMRLTRKRRATINYSSVMKEQKEFIPFYTMDWLFGKRYQPYYFGCTGPSINPDNDRTPNDDESRSPRQSRE